MMAVKTHVLVKCATDTHVEAIATKIVRRLFPMAQSVTVLLIEQYHVPNYYRVLVRWFADVREPFRFELYGTDVARVLSALLRPRRSVMSSAERSAREHDARLADRLTKEWRRWRCRAKEGK